MKNKALVLLKSSKELFIFIGIVIVVMLILTIFQMSQGHIEKNPDSYGVILLSAAIYVIHLRRRLQKRNSTFASVIESKKISLQGVLWLVFLGACINVWFFSFFSTLTHFSLFQNYIIQSLEQTNTLLQQQSMLMLVLAAGICIPLIEELLFRGFMQTEIAKAFSRKTTIVLQAFVYAVIHIQPFQIFYTFLLGLILGMLRVRYQSIIAPILVHVSFNLCNLLLIKNLKISFTNSLVLLACFTLILFWQIRDLRKEKTA